MSGQRLTLSFQLASDGAFGRGDGVAGFVDQEVQHDEYGCPYLGGKTVKGILVNECADILTALPSLKRNRWETAARALFGQPGSLTGDSSRLHIGNATLPRELRDAIRTEIDQENLSLTRSDVLESLTTVRYQTAMDDEKGTPKEHTLRSMRVILRKTFFQADLWLQNRPEHASADEPEMDDLLMLLAACVKAFRRAGTSRNRGYGRLCQVMLTDESNTDLLETHFPQFCKEVLS